MEKRRPEIVDLIIGRQGGWRAADQLLITLSHIVINIVTLSPLAPIYFGKSPCVGMR